MENFIFYAVRSLTNKRWIRKLVFFYKIEYGLPPNTFITT